MKNYQIRIKHVLEQEWIDKGIFYCESLNKAAHIAHLLAEDYYNDLAEKYNLPTIEDFVEGAEELTGKKYGEDLPCDDVDILFWSYFGKVMNWSATEV